MTLQSARTITHATAETQFVDVFCAYRRFGRPAGLPLVMLQHFFAETWTTGILR